ncbi:MAG: BON domain-containing protein [Acidobacteriaceae bacterium]
MTRKLCFSSPALLLALVAMVFLSAGCNKKPTDAQLAANVQKQIGADPALQGQPIAVAANGGTVTLNGTVNGPGSRELASKDASKVGGVKTVVNNLTMANGPYPSGGAPMDGQPPQSYSGMPPPPPPPSMNGQPQQGGLGMPPPSGYQGAPPPPQGAQSIVVPAGARVRVRLGQTLSTRGNQTGDPFSGTLVSPIVVNGQTVIFAGARARGVVTESKSLGRFKGQAVLAIRLDSLSANGRTYMVRTSRVERVEQGKGKRSAILTGGGAGLGAIIGGLAGGGKGALIGGLLGGGGGAAGSAFTGNRDLVLPAESILTFDLERSLTVNP